MKNNDKPSLPLNEEVEVSPGFVIERRSMLAGLGALAAAGIPALSRAAGMTFAEFLAAANPVARELVGDASALRTMPMTAFSGFARRSTSYSGPATSTSSRCSEITFTALLPDRRARAAWILRPASSRDPSTARPSSTWRRDR